MGVGKSEGFQINYKDGQFKIACNIEVVAGYGCGGEFCVTVYKDTLESFFQFLYHQIKNANYKSSISMLFERLQFRSVAYQFMAVTPLVP